MEENMFVEAVLRQSFWFEQFDQLLKCERGVCLFNIPGTPNFCREGWRHVSLLTKKIYHIQVKFFSKFILYSDLEAHIKTKIHNEVALFSLCIFYLYFETRITLNSLVGQQQTDTE